MNLADQKILEKCFLFWDKLSAEQKKRICDHSFCASFPAGQNIHRGGEDCIGVMVVKSGRLRNYILSDEGKEVTLFRLNQGEVCVLSASCILTNITFDINVDAEKDSEVIIVDSSVFESICSENVYAENFSHKIITSHFSEVMWAMEQILFMSFEKRLAIFLIDQSALDGSDCVSLTHETVANHMGSAREVVSRMLKYFQSEGIVELSRGDIKILDKARLREMAS